MKVTVEKKKKSVVVLDWGHAPFAVQEKQGRRVYIPDGFTVETFCFNRTWIAQTSVYGDLIQYQFFLKSEPHKTSEWQKSASAALAVANERIKNRFYKPGSNGALVVGVTYPNLQDEIIRRFGSQLDKLDAEETEEDDESSMEQDDCAARAPQFAFDEDETTFSPMKRKQCEPMGQDDDDDDELKMEPEGLEPISLEPFKEETFVFRDTTCGSLDADIKAMDSWFSSSCKKTEHLASSLGYEFRSSSFEESQDADLFLHSNEPLEFE